MAKAASRSARGAPKSVCHQRCRPSRPQSTLARTLLFSTSSNRWKTQPIRGRHCSGATSRPLRSRSRISPSPGANAPARQASSVDLPAPEGPTTATKAPRGTVRFRSRKSQRSARRTPRPETRMCASPSGAAARAVEGAAAEGVLADDAAVGADVGAERTSALAAGRATAGASALAPVAGFAAGEDWEARRFTGQARVRRGATPPRAGGGARRPKPGRAWS